MIITLRLPCIKLQLCDAKTARMKARGLAAIRDAVQAAVVGVQSLVTEAHASKH